MTYEMPAAPKRVFSCVCCWTLIVNCRWEKIPFATPPMGGVYQELEGSKAPNSLTAPPPPPPPGREFRTKGKK